MTAGLPDDLTFRDRAVYLGSADALVLADLHVGRDAASSVELPLGERDDLLERVEALLGAFDPAEVVLAGDLLHEFGDLPPGVAATVRDLAAAVREAGARPVVTPGNHDTLLGEVWEGPVEPEHRLGDTVVCHGHERPAADADRYVVGHDHPAITIEGQRRPCFLVGPAAGGGEVVVLPAFTRLAPGTPVNGLTTADLNTPLVADLDACRAVVRDARAGETLAFPRLGAFRRML